MDDHRAHIVQRLSQRIAMRATADPQHSYTARLLQGPKEAVLRKVGEEALEVVLAAQSTDRAALIGELADLWYHTMVAAQRCSIDPAEVFEELEKRYTEGGTETADGRPPALKNQTVPTAF
jgi:phosphoribosyl-ATP pyrophosphohydrolase